MKIYKYWQLEQGLVDKGGVIKCYGGSNISQEDAALKAKEKIEKIKRKIAGEAHLFDDYDVEIREEILHEIDPKAIVTRNRYGAQVLNVQDLMILDIDEPKSSLLDLFRKQDQAQGKQKIIEMVRKLAQKPAYQGCGFRVYETQKGIRVIVLGKTFDARSTASDAMMKDFHCDALYTLLCQKQNCFRARLTPKPGRMNPIKLKGHRVKFPRSLDEENEFRKWLLEYEAISKDFSVCKFIEQVGTGYLLSDAIRYHDEATGAYRSQTLA